MAELNPPENVPNGKMPEFGTGDYPFPTESGPSDFKMSYPPNLDTQIKKLRIALQDWKEVVLPIKSVLLWEKQWHPTALIGGSTVVFMLLWLLDPSILTALSFLGLFLTICDYCVPTIASSLFKNEVWTGEKEKELEDVCVNLVVYKTRVELFFASFCRMRSINPKLYFTLAVVILSLLAWIGNSLNNLFLTYLCVTTILLLPGLDNHGMLDGSGSTLSKLVIELIENAKSKIQSKQTKIN